MNITMQRKFSRLREWTKSLAHVVESALPEMEEALDGKIKLPKNCPSKEAAAALVFRQVQKKLSEVIAAATAIDKVLKERPELN